MADLRDVYHEWLAFLTTDWEVAFLAIDRSVCFVARYGSTGMDIVERWPIQKIVRKARRLGEIVDRENKASGPG